MKVRIKEYIDRRYESIWYKVKYLWLGFIWRTFDDYASLSMAIRKAKDLEGRNLPRYLTIEEAEKEVMQAKKEQE